MTYHCDQLLLIGYTNSEFQSDRDSHKSTSRFVFTLGGEIVSWRNMKQSYIIDSTMEVEYVVDSKVAKEVIWLQKFLIGLRVVMRGNVGVEKINFAENVINLFMKTLFTRAFYDHKDN